MIPWGSREYSQTVRGQAHWGPILSYDVVVKQIEKMFMMPSDLLRDVVDGGIDVEYDTYFPAHPIPRLKDLDEPMGAEDDDDDEDDDDRGEGDEGGGGEDQ